MAKKSEVKILIDFVCFTISTLDFFGAGEGEITDEQSRFVSSEIKQRLGFGGLQSWIHRRAFNGYNVAEISNGILICYGGQDHFFVQLSGVGCRTWETLHPELLWSDWISQLQRCYGSLHFSRLDVACDTFGLLDIRKVQMATMAEQFISKWRTYLCQIGNKENSVIFGSSKSDFRFRIYDKTLERIHAGVSDQDVPQQWVRLEYQLRDDSVLSFLRPWQESGDISQVYFGILKNQLLYYSQFDGHHYDRIKLKPWWRQLLGNASKIKMAYQGGMEYNLQRLERYIFEQAGSSIKTYLLAHDGDLTRLLDGVQARELNDRQRQLLDQAQHVELPDDKGVS